MNLRAFSYLLLIATALIVVAAQVFTDQNLLTYLNLLPLLICFVIFERTIRVGGGKWPLLSPLRRACGFGLVVGVVLPLFISHVGWLLRFEGIVADRFSEENFLAFLFLPSIVLISGVIGCITGAIISRFIKS